VWAKSKETLLSCPLNHALKDPTAPGHRGWNRLSSCGGAKTWAEKPHSLDLPTVSDFVVKNLMDVEDSAEGAAVQARFARKYLDSEHLGVSYFRYAPGFRAEGGHRHEVQEEAYVVVGGSGRIRLDDEVIELRHWDVIRVAPAVVRGFDAGPDGLELIAIGADKPEGGDGVRVADRWSSAEN
jgi:quercetin dioxygenase-like cupin family protein